MSTGVDSMLTKLAVGQLWRAPAEARCASRSIVKIVEVEGAKLIAFRRKASSLEYVRQEKFLLWAHRAGARLVVHECEIVSSESN
jgi:hypothetical protein